MHDSPGMGQAVAVGCAPDCKALRDGWPWPAPLSELCGRLQGSGLVCQAFWSFVMLSTTRRNGTRFTPLQDGATEAPRNAQLNALCQ